MSRASVLARGQAAAEAGMVDACTVRRLTGSTVDDFSGVSTPDYDDVYTGKCRVQQRATGATRVDAGEDSILLLGMELQLPMSVTGLQVRDLVTITASVNDPDLVGRVFLVRDLAHKTDATARRVGIQERT